MVNAREHDHPELHVLDPQLDDVLAIFRALPDPYHHFEPAAVESALRAFPDRDGVAAAHIVASKVQAGQAYTVHVNTLLLGVLRRLPAKGEQHTATPGPAAAAASSRRPPRAPKPWDGALERALETGL